MSIAFIFIYSTFFLEKVRYLLFKMVFVRDKYLLKLDSIYNQFT